MTSCGSYSSYVAGCRCDECKRANAAYHRKHRDKAEIRRKAVRYSRRRNHAAYLALRYLRQNNSRAYFQVMDEAQAWMEQRHPN